MTSCSRDRLSVSTSTSSAVTTGAKAIPGYYFDPVTNRYYKGKPPAPVSSSIPKSSPASSSNSGSSSSSCSTSSSLSSPCATPPFKPRKTEPVSRFLQRRQAIRRSTLEQQCIGTWRSSPVHLKARLVTDRRQVQPTTHLDTDGCFEAHLAPANSAQLSDVRWAGDDWGVRILCAHQSGTVLISQIGKEGSASGRLDLVQQGPSFGLTCQSRLSAVRWLPDPTNDRAFSITTLGGRGASGSVRILALANDDESCQLRGELKPAVDTSLFETRWSPSLDRLALGAHQRGLLYDVPTLRCLRSIFSGKSDVLAQHFSHDGSLVFSGCRSGKATMIDLRAPDTASARISPFHLHRAPIANVFQQVKRPHLVTSALDGSIRITDLRALRRPLLICQDPSRSIESWSSAESLFRPIIDDQERELAVLGLDEVVRVFSLTNGQSSELVKAPFSLSQYGEAHPNALVKLELGFLHIRTTREWLSYLP